MNQLGITTKLKPSLQSSQSPWQKTLHSVGAQLYWIEPNTLKSNAFKQSLSRGICNWSQEVPNNFLSCGIFHHCLPTLIFETKKCPLNSAWNEILHLMLTPSLEVKVQFISIEKKISVEVQLRRKMWRSKSLSLRNHIFFINSFVIVVNSADWRLVIIKPEHRATPSRRSC